MDQPVRKTGGAFNEPGHAGVMKENAHRPAWLVAGLAATSAVVAYRVGGVVGEVLFLYLRGSSFGLAAWLGNWSYHFGLLLGLLFAILCATWQHRILRGKSLRTNRTMLVVIAVMAVLPLHVETRQVPVQPELPPEVFCPVDVEPVLLVCKLIDGDRTEQEVVLTNTHISSATPEPRQTYTYDLRLSLTPDGQAVLEMVSRQNIGKRLGFWVDGELIASPPIVSPFSQSFVRLGLDTTADEATRLAAGITKSECRINVQ